MILQSCFLWDAFGSTCEYRSHLDDQDHKVLPSDPNTERNTVLELGLSILCFLEIRFAKFKLYHEALQKAFGYLT